MSLDQVDACRHYGGEYDDLSATMCMLDVEIFLLDIGEMSIDQKLGSPLYNFFNICMCTSCRG